MSRLPTDYTELVKNFQCTLSDDDLLEIELKAKALSFDECLGYLLIQKDDLTAEDLDIAKRIHARGRFKSIYEAACALDKKQGAEFLLSKLASEFATSPEQIAAGNTFQFNAFIDEQVSSNTTEE